MKMIQWVKMRLMKRTVLSKEFCWMLFLIFDLKVDFFDNKFTLLYFATTAVRKLLETS